MSRSNADARDAILTGLRRSLGKPHGVFKSVLDSEDHPGVPSPVTRAPGEGMDLAKRFGKKLEEVLGTYEIAEDVAAIPSRIAERVSGWVGVDARELGKSSHKELLSWNSGTLPIARLDQKLLKYGLSIVEPDEMHDSTTRGRASTISVGLTGVDAAFAGTGSMLLVTGPGKSRSASLLPLHHIALVPVSKIYPTFEEWLSLERGAGTLDDRLRQNSQWAFVTGPSKSADIELNLTLGVHGPRDVHALIF